MNEEEKQAVEKMQYVLDLINKNGQYTADEKDIKNIIVITNLIIKQQKEIEKLKSKKYILNAEIQEIKEIPISDDYISKDKIKEQIRMVEETKRKGKGIDNYSMHYCIMRLKELLGE